ncbi:MAG: hypothetical protein IKH78_02725 [Ruminococcus sp.]|nr:hypothetical protein [Ruminococcus sp.]
MSKRLVIILCAIIVIFTGGVFYVISKDAGGQRGPGGTQGNVSGPVTTAPDDTVTEAQTTSEAKTTAADKKTTTKTTADTKKTTTSTAKKTETTTKAATTAKSATTAATTKKPAETTTAIKLAVTEESITRDTMAIGRYIIPIAFDYLDEEVLDVNQVVFDLGDTSHSQNDFIFGHNDKAFGLLDSVKKGDIIAINMFGGLNYFRVERSERAFLTDDGRDIIFDSDGAGGNVVLRHDHGYHGLLLVTEDKSDSQNHRWVVLLKQVD